MGRLEFFEKFFDKLWIDFVVGITEHDVLTGDFAKSRIAGASGGAGVWLIDEDDSWVLFFGGLEEFGSVVGGAIVDENNFEILVGLIEDVADEFLRGNAGVVEGDDDAN